jgi:5-methyltetrahydropteroyltriglutamate--homocysteine methyltransferase
MFFPLFAVKQVAFPSFIHVPNQLAFERVQAFLHLGFQGANIALKEINGQYTFMDTLIDDIGSFPLPPTVNRETYNKAYQLAREAMANGRDIGGNEFIRENFYNVTINSFKRKIGTGLDVINSPWHYDGIRQVSDVVHKAMEKGTFVVDEKDAFLPEVRVIEAEAKSLSEEFGKKISLRACMFGPMEQYLQEIGTVPYRDVLDGFAETIRRFAKNSIVNTKYVKTEVVSIDEPSFGFLNIAAENEALCEVLEKAFNFQGAVRQIHLHSAARLPDLLCVKNIDVLSFEYAASPRNIEAVSKKMLDDADKQIRVGVSRTDIDNILAELNDKGVAKPSVEQLVESEGTIRKRYLAAKEKYGERMTFTGPDCGLGSWPSQETAELLLERTVKAVRGT